MAPDLATSGTRELAAALGVIGLGDAAGHWTVDKADPNRPETGALRLSSRSNTARIFFAANDRAAVNLEINGLVRPDDPDAIVVHSIAPVPKMPRSPVAPPGRVGRPGLRNVAMAGLLREATTSDNLGARFREEALL